MVVTLFGSFIAASIILAQAVSAIRSPSLVVFIAASIFAQDLFIQAFIPSMRSPSYLPNILLFACCIAPLALRPRMLSSVLPLSLGQLLYISLLGYACVSTSWSANTVYLEVNWFRFLGPIFLCIIVAPASVAEPAEIAALWRLQIRYGGLILAVFTFIGEWRFRALIINGDSVGRYEDRFGNPLEYGSIAGLMLVVAVLLQPKSIWQRIVQLVVIPMALYVAIQSGSRGQLFSAIIAIVIAYPLTLNRTSFQLRLAYWFAGAMLLFGIFAFLPTLAELFASITGATSFDTDRYDQGAMESAYGGRIEMAITLLGSWSASIATIIFGLGNGSAFKIIGIYPHIVPLEILAEEGIVGLTLYVGLMVACIASAIKCLRIYENTSYRSSIAVLIALMLFGILLSLKQGSIWSNTSPFMFLFILERLRKAKPENTRHS